MIKTRLVIAVLALSAVAPIATYGMPPPQHVVKGPIMRVTPVPKHTPCTHPGCPPQPHPTNNHRK